MREPPECGRPGRDGRFAHVPFHHAVAPLASLIGAGGYGDLIFAGIQLYDPVMLLAGALATAGLALAADALLSGVQRLLMRRPGHGARERGK